MQHELDGALVVGVPRFGLSLAVRGAVGEWRLWYWRSVVGPSLKLGVSLIVSFAKTVGLFPCTRGAELRSSSPDLWLLA